MEYVLGFTLSLEPTIGSLAVRRDAVERARREARHVLERDLGGSATHVLLAWLDCVETGALPALDGPPLDPTTVQFRWWQAQVNAVKAAYLLLGIDFDAWEIEACGEFWEHAFFGFEPAAPERYHLRNPWIDAFLTRLHELEFSCEELMTPQHGAKEHEMSGSVHPVFAADALFLQCQPGIDVDAGINALPPVARRLYTDLRSQLEAKLCQQAEDLATGLAADDDELARVVEDAPAPHSAMV